MNKEINPLAHPELARYFLKGIDIYRQIKPIQEEFANGVESQDYKKANESSKQLIKLMTEFHSLFYYRPSERERGVREWRSSSNLLVTNKRLYVLISDIEKAAVSVDLKKFVLYADRAYHQMFKMLEFVKEYAEEGLPIPSHHKRKIEKYGHEYKPIGEMTKGRYVLDEVKEQVKIRNKVMKQIYSQRSRLENWKEFTKHHRRKDIEEEPPIERIEDNTDELDDLIKEFEEEI